MIRPPAAVAAALLFAPLAPADDALLKTARAANKATLDKITSWRGSIAYQSKEEPTPPKATGEFLWAGSKVRCKVTEGTRTRDMARPGQGQRVLETDTAHPGDIDNFGEIHVNPIGLPPGDPWECGLFAFTRLQGPPFVPLDEWLSDKSVSDVKAEPATRGGKPVVRITATASRWKFQHTFDLDPARGHLVVAHRVVNESGPQRDAPPMPCDYTAEVTEFQEVKPGVAVPVKATMTGTAAARAVGYDWSATGLAVNDPVPADAFVLKFPPKLRVVDEVKQGIFRADANGESGDERAMTPSGQPWVYGGMPPPEGSAAPKPSAAASYDPMVVWPIALVVGAVVVALGVIVGVLGRRRKK